MLAPARRYSATSAATLELLRPLAPPEAEIDLVYAGVPDELFTLERGERDYLLYFGRLDVFQKGLEHVDCRLRASAAVRPGVRLKLAGRGKDAARVRALAREHGVESSVEMLGAVSEAERQALFAGALVQLMPSRFEGFGMVAAEAMAAGVPLVAAAAGSLPEVVDLAPRRPARARGRCAAALAAAVARLLDNPRERAEPGVIVAGPEMRNGYRWYRIMTSERFAWLPAPISPGRITGARSTGAYHRSVGGRYGRGSGWSVADASHPWSW